MFGIGLSELVLLAVVALVVLGPEKLPHATRMAGAWLGRIRRTMMDLQRDIEREISVHEIRSHVTDEVDRFQSSHAAISTDVKTVANTLRQTVNLENTEPTLDTLAMAHTVIADTIHQ